MTDFHVYAPPVTRTSLKRMPCPICKRSTRNLVQTFEWHEPTTTCLSCGDSWGGTERLMRPCARHWRRDAVKAAKLTAFKAGLYKRSPR